MQAKTGMLQGTELVLAGTAPRTGVKVTDRGLCMAPEVTGCNHAVAPVIALPAEDKDTRGMIRKHLLGKAPPGALHQLEFSDAKGHRVGIHGTHPLGRDQPRFGIGMGRATGHESTIHL